ncbi:MAG: divalent-cation tolerance protein CutA [Novosphingobium sp.]
MSESRPALIWCPFPDRESAAAAARALLDERLIACANVLPGMLSIYEWRGERGEDEEAGTLFKTDASLLEKAIARLGELHPYEQPAILGWRCDAASPETAAWLAALPA